MSKYTIQLNNVCDIFSRTEVEGWFKDYLLEDYLTNEQINVIIKANIWNKNRLAKMIVNHYYFNEIGFETPALFRHYTKIFMNEIMEKYIPIIYTQALEYDLLINENYTENYSRTLSDKNISTGSSSASSSAKGNGLTLNNTTPSNMVSKEDILAGKYSSSSTGNESSSSANEKISSNSNDNRNTQEEYIKSVKGNHGIDVTSQKLIQQYRDIIFTTNKNIIDDCQVLFMGVY